MKSIFSKYFSYSFLVLTILLSSSFTFMDKDVNEEIQFHDGNWSESLALAGKENKMIFINVHASWCGPCKRMKKYSFNDKKVAEFYNENFINVSIDGDTSIGERFRKKYKIYYYPTNLYLDSKGNLIHRESGFQKPVQLLKTARKVLN